MAIRSQSDQAGGDNLEKEQAQLYATKIVAYAASIKNTIDQMLMTGTPQASLVFLNPQEAAFDTPPHINKIFHPDGGGLNYEAATAPPFQGVDDLTNAGGWYIGRFNNVEWTPSTSNDIIITAHRIDRSACEYINRQITGTTDIPALTGETETYLVDDSYHSTGTADLTETVCADCEGYPALCVSNSGATSFSYYNIISGQ